MKKSILFIYFLAISLVSFAQDTQIATGKTGFTACEIQVDDYDVLLNKTRSNAGVGSLERKEELDAYCYERCIRLLGVVLKDPEAYVLDYNVFSVEAHKNFTKMENAYNWLGWKVNSPGQKIDEGYNGSPGHYKNRVNPKWKYYGTCSIVVSFKAINPDYDPNVISQKYIQRQLLISYEVFE